MRYSIALTDALNEEICAHLVRADGQEDLCFAIWYPSRGATRFTALLHHLVLPAAGDRSVHGNASFFPQYFERTLGEALAAGGGLAFLHSHPDAGWQGMSLDDTNAEAQIAPSVLAATTLPLVGLTLGAKDRTWSARFWNRAGPGLYKPTWCETVRVVGSTLRMHYCDRLRPPPEHRRSQSRTLSAWGSRVQADLARLRIGIVGLGSVGSIVAESLVRTGVQNVRLIDFDVIKEENLDRTLHARPSDADHRASKVQVVARELRQNATAKDFAVEAYQVSLCDEQGYRLALDCDLLFSCVDRPWPRSVLNFLTYAHVIHVIDGGIAVSRTPRATLRGADWKAHTVGPGHRCLLCLKQYGPGFVALEQRGDLDDPVYIESLPAEHPLRANQNVFAFSLSLASIEVLQLVALVATPGSIGPPGPQNYHLVTGRIDIGEHACDPGCLFPGLLAQGELAGPPGVRATTQPPAAPRRNGRRRVRSA